MLLNGIWKFEHVFPLRPTLTETSATISLRICPLQHTHIMFLVRFFKYLLK